MMLSDSARSSSSRSSAIAARARLLLENRLGAREARTIVEDVRRKIAELAEPHERSAYGILTASIGVTAIVPELRAPELRGDLQNLTRLLADAALYDAKRTGRNRGSIDSNLMARDRSFPITLPSAATVEHVPQRTAESLMLRSEPTILWYAEMQYTATTDVD